MADNSPKLSEHAIAQKTQEKFEFYLLSLVFTLLALSIQTAKFGASVPSTVLELMGWLCFVVSGLAGLSRIEWTSIIRVQMATQSGFEEEKFQLKELQLKGQTHIHVLETGQAQPITERIANKEFAISKLAPHIAKLECRSHIKYELHKYGFVAGILCVASSRGYVPLVSVLKAIGWL